MDNLELKNYAGQNSDVIISKRKDGSIFVTFRYTDGCGSPSLELDKLEKLIEKAKILQE